jgi:hypothetical protein
LRRRDKKAIPASEAAIVPGSGTAATNTLSNPTKLQFAEAVPFINWIFVEVSVALKFAMNGYQTVWL